ncbi:coiled-coil domain-containing protein 81-like isoform X1 [Coturnix japonica]|uniref:coiled-coil domain-containing protein 81-like isoform X1 n=1 Tax=Coturnix japonica TaxID=93934 RepID=UPI000776B767|nr:coiled-coil domain-containing protein 81-like isoform X1 [Coturnix japonica]
MGGGHRKAECHCWGARVHSPLSLPVGKFHARGTGTQKIFWDTGWVGPMVPPYTAAVRANVWDTVSAHVRQQLLQCKGIRIPTLGSFDTILERVQVGAGYLAVQRPVFYLARNLAEGHRLTVDMSYMPGNKVLQPMQQAQIAATTFVSSKRVVRCIQATMSLFSRCIAQGRNTALILRDIGMLLIEDAQVQMKYYCDFLEAMSGKVTLKGVLLRVPGVPGSVIPRSAAPAFLTRSGCVIVFPEFELQCIHCVPFSGTKKGWQKEAAQDMNGSARDQRPAGKHPREEKPPAAQHGTALGGTAGRQGVKLKGTSLAMKAFLQTGTQGLEQR